MANKKTNTNKKFGTMWLYIILAILGFASALFGLVTLFFPAEGAEGNEIPKIGALIGGALVMWWAVKKAIALDKAD